MTRLGMTMVFFVAASLCSAAAVAQQCDVPNRPVTFEHAVIPPYPQSARYANEGSATVLVRVSLDNAGTVLDARVIQASSNPAMNDAALGAASTSRYLPKLVNCSPVGARVIFRADFAEDVETTVSLSPSNPPGLFTTPTPAP